MACNKIIIAFLIRLRIRWHSGFSLFTVILLSKESKIFSDDYEMLSCHLSCSVNAHFTVQILGVLSTFGSCETYMHKTIFQ